MRRITAVGALVLALAACSEPPHAGKVYDKDHDAAWTEYQLMCIARDSKTAVCTAWMPYQIQHPERWLLCLIDDNDPKHRGCLDVPATSWDRYPVGSHYPDPK